MFLGGSEKRREPRQQFFSPVEFILKSEPERILEGVRTNISKSGLGIFSYVPLNEGQEIIFKSSLPVRRSEYTVRWSEKLLEDFFTVGLRIMEEDQDR